MKIIEHTGYSRPKRSEEGLATVVFIALLAIMLMLATASGMALIHLHDEVKFLEKQQIKRLNGAQTNSIAITHFNVIQADSK